MKFLKALLLGGALVAFSSIPLLADTPLLFEGFEFLGRGALDANYDGGPNNTTSNYWWGQFPPNLQVVGPENSISPHGGTNMVRGVGSGFPDLDRNFFNIAYRLNNSNVVTGNVMLDWWFYDVAGSNSPANVNYQDYVALAFYSNIPTNADHEASATPDPGNELAALSLGASYSQGAGFQSTNYQAQIRNTTSSNAYDTANGWFNLPVVRSVGWHHARILVSPAFNDGTATATFYLDNMTNAVLTNSTASTNGFNCIALQAEYTGSLTGYFDDITFDVVPLPVLSIAPSGANVVVSWPEVGWTLQTATNLTNNSFTDITNATSPYTNNINGAQQYFRLRH